MKIEEGKFYKTRDGKEVGPVERICDVQWDYWIPSFNFRCYRKDGLTSLTGWDTGPFDLIEELDNFGSRL